MIIKESTYQEAFISRLKIKLPKQEQQQQQRINLNDENSEYTFLLREQKHTIIHSTC